MNPPGNQPNGSSASPGATQRSAVTPRKAPLVVKGTSGKVVAIAVISGIALLAFVIWGIMGMSRDVSSHALLTGTILAKHFQPRQEEQLTVGPGGLDQRDIDGTYTMDVKTPDGQTYTVFVEKPIYQSHQVGDELSFLPPPARSQ